MGYYHAINAAVQRDMLEWQSNPIQWLLAYPAGNQAPWLPNLPDSIMQRWPPHLCFWTLPDVTGYVPASYEGPQPLHCDLLTRRVHEAEPWLVDHVANLAARDFNLTLPTAKARVRTCFAEYHDELRRVLVVAWSNSPRLWTSPYFLNL